MLGQRLHLGKHGLKSWSSGIKLVSSGPVWDLFGFPYILSVRALPVCVGQMMCGIAFRQQSCVDLVPCQLLGGPGQFW